MKSKSSTIQQKALSCLSDGEPQVWVPEPYQTRYVNRMKSSYSVAGWVDPGLGKTSCVLKAFSDLLKSGMAERLLVIAPRRVCRLVWPQEVRKWKQFNHLRLVVLHGPKKDVLLHKDADIFCVTVDGLKWLMENDHFKVLNPDILCVDESRKFKDLRSQRAKLLKPKLTKFSRRWTMTGTPATNGYEDIFGQLYITDMGATLGQYITQFRMRYFDSSGFGGYTLKLKQGAEAQIHKAIKPTVLRLDAKDYLKLPRVKDVPVLVELPPAARKVYDSMEKDMIAFLDGGELVTAQSASSVSGKCHQVANGGLYAMDDTTLDGLLRVGTDKRKWYELHDAKTEAVAEILEELGGKPALIAYDYHHDLERLLKLLGKDAPRMGVSDKRDEVMMNAWNRGELPFLLAHPASIGHGLNMQESGGDIIWHSLTWDLELYDQMNARLARRGSRHQVVRSHQIIAQGTVDEAIVRSLASKDRTQRGLLDALRTYVKARRAA